MKILFCGSGSFAVPSLSRLRQAGHELLALVAQPARPAGRGGRLRPTPAAQAARELGVTVLECPDVNAPAFLDRLRALRPDVLCVADFGQRIRREARALAPAGAINLHGSLLPELRGAAPVNWAILRGLRRTGVTTFRLVARMDAGPVYLQEAADVRTDETAEELKERLAVLGADLFLRTIDLLAAGNLRAAPQDEARATLAPLLERRDGALDWSGPAEEVRNRVHGTWPWPGGRALFEHAGGRPVEVVLAHAAAEEGAAEPGRVDGELLVGCGTGRLRILHLRPASRHLVNWNDFVNGYRVQEGDRFLPPRQEPAADADRRP